MTTLVAFVVVFGVIVFIHELGHFLVAKRVGIEVFQFSLGYGPALLSFKRGSTVYFIRALPLGGFVKLAGMDQALEGPPGPEVDRGKSFNDKPLWQRMATIAAGPLMNFVLAAVLFAVFFGLIPEVWPPTVQQVEPGSPAAEAGLMPGDQFLVIDGHPIEEPGDVNKYISMNPGRQIQITVIRDGSELVLSVTPEYDETRDRALIGILLSEQKRRGPIDAFVNGFTATVAITWDLIIALLRMITGQVPADLAGPIGIYKLVDTSAQQGPLSVIWLAALLSVNLGLLNFLPVPVLDGGWLMFLSIEGIRGKPLDPEQRAFAQFVGLAVLVLLMLYATYKDLGRILSG